MNTDPQILAASRDIPGTVRTLRRLPPGELMACITGAASTSHAAGRASTLDFLGGVSIAPLRPQQGDAAPSAVKQGSNDKPSHSIHAAGLRSVHERYNQVRSASEFEAIETVRFSNAPSDVWHLRHLSGGELQEIDPFVNRDADGVAQLSGKEEFEGFIGACLFYGVAQSERGGYFFPRTPDGWKAACEIAEDANPEVTRVNMLLLQGVLLMNPAILPEASILFKEMISAFGDQREAEASVALLPDSSTPGANRPLVESPPSNDKSTIKELNPLEPSPC